MKKVTVYTSPSCPYCVRAKDLLQRRGIAYEEVQIGWDDEKAWKDLEQRTGMKTVPQIFFGEKCIGGFTDLAALDQAGPLAQLLS
jgi:glutaredoxin 3